nr:dihydroxyacetone kinase subunit DhaL [uncultured Gellertiella sp.]
MREHPERISGLIAACRAAIAEHAEALSEFDRRIGDGDHGSNMRRGAEAVYAERDRLALLPLAEALEGAGRILVETIGGASGPLYGTLLMALGREAARLGDVGFELLFKPAIAAVARRGRSDIGDKTLLDVLYPLELELSRHRDYQAIAQEADRAARRTTGMKAMRGRAKFLGDRSIGHIDPGAASCAVLAGAICAYLEGQNAA